jgi:TonB family protein
MLGCAVLFAAATAVQTAGRVAFLVESADPAAELATAIEAPDPLVRATAARVAAVRNVAAVLPQLRDALARETDPNAAREEIRALVLVGDAGDVDRAAAAARTLPTGAVDVVARAVARRADAYDLYIAKLRPLGFAADAAFFTQSLWQRGKLPVSVGARTLGNGNPADWHALLRALRESGLAMDDNVLSVAVNASSEQIRTDSIWYLVHGFAFDPKQIGERVRAAIDAPSEEASLREAFGRELVRRMLGGERKDDPRWPEWLQSEEADALIGSEIGLFEYFTDRELAARRNHCDIASNDCRLPPKARGGQIPSIDVTRPAFLLPDVLPPGLAEATAAEGGCRNAWLGLGQASVDEAGRVRELTVKPVDMSKSCERVVSTLMRLSLARTDSIGGPRSTGNLLLIHVAGTPICLDEGPISAAPAVTHEVGNGVQAPVVKRKVEPQFPASARRSMGEGRSVVVAIEATISKEGCLRNIRLVQQSPFPDLNTAALVALAQWRFEPGRLRGEPVDVLFHLAVNFKTNG